MRTINILSSTFVIMLMSLSSCNDFLDVSPVSEVTSDIYLSDELHLEAYTLPQYEVLDLFKIGADNNTDNQMSNTPWNAYTDSYYRLPLSGGSWNFAGIYQVNHFMDEVLPKWQAGTITGTKNKIEHYIGEMYFFRAYKYFYLMQCFGDMPIVKHKLPADKNALIAASSRKPHNEVARFIISDLDSAIMLMNATPLDGNKNRLYGDVAQLMKSRVALYEATWLKYFKNTPFVPGSAQWPGKNQNPDFQYPSGSIDDEINWFLDRAIESAEVVADSYELTPNNKVLPQNINQNNPYLDMFGAENLDSYSEVMLWRDYDFGLNIVHDVTAYAATGNYSVGLTRGLMDSYLMVDGLPIYAASMTNPYLGDGITSAMVANRDSRMFLFVKQPGQLNGYLGSKGSNTKGYITEGQTTNTAIPWLYPDIYAGSAEDRYSTGLACRKGWNPDMKFWENQKSSTGRIAFRASEAYLNYIEAYYERNNSISGKASEYWEKIRERAGIEPDYQATIDATIMDKEKLDWGSYSGGVQLTDKTLYNIRRERRLELMAEGYRMMDLRRWRAMDQLITSPYKIEGMKIYSQEIADAGWFGPGGEWLWQQWSIDQTSLRSESDYLMPLHVFRDNNPIYSQGGVKWKMAHYWEPITIETFKSTSNQASGFTDSPLYQNPYWGMTTGDPAIQ